MIQQWPSLEELRSFVEVARMRSFAGAARELHVTASAVSHRVASLEDFLGATLFQRTTRTVRLTSVGRELLVPIQDGLGQIHAGISRVRKPAQGTVLTVSCSTSFALLRLLRHLPVWNDAHPGHEVHVFADDRLADPRRDDIDVCIRYGAGNYPGLVSKRLTTEWVFPVCSPAFQKRHRLSDATRLARMPLIHHDVMRDHPGRVDFPRWFSRAGIKTAQAEQGIRVSHAHMALSAAMAGQGVALGRTSLVALALKEGLLVTPARPKVRSGLAYHFVTAEEPAAVVLAFRNWLLAALSTNSRRRNK